MKQNIPEGPATFHGHRAGSTRTIHGPVKYRVKISKDESRNSRFNHVHTSFYKIISCQDPIWGVHTKDTEGQLANGQPK